MNKSIILKKYEALKKTISYSDIKTLIPPERLKNVSCKMMTNSHDCDECIGLTDCINCVGSTQCVNGHRLTRCLGLFDCQKCTDCVECSQCNGCTNCLYCVGLSDKREGYWLLNELVDHKTYMRAWRATMFD